MITYDWREQAKTASTVADDYAVEKAFMDQAYASVQNKCGPLMRAPHQIGFEIVHKNDTATRMVGIFGFRAGRQLFYAPVFFLSGEIKGTDLLYRHMTKTFVPSEEDWITYLISNARREVGRSIDRNESRRHPSRINLDMLAYPPMGGGGFGKRSSSLEAPDTTDSDWTDEQMLADPDGFDAHNMEEAERDKQHPGVLLSDNVPFPGMSMRDTISMQLGGEFGDDDMLSNLGADDLDRVELAMALSEDYGIDETFAEQLLNNPEVTVRQLVEAAQQKQASYGAPSSRRLSAAWENWIDTITEIPKLQGPGLREFLVKGGAQMATKLASLMEESIEFHTEIVRNYQPADWMPEELITLAKQAAQARADNMLVETPVLELRYKGPAHAQLFKYGFVIDDARQKTQLNPVYAQHTDQLSQALEPGVWDLLMPDGDREKVFIGYASDSYRIGRATSATQDNSCAIYPDDCPPTGYVDPRLRKMVVTRLGGNHASVVVAAHDLHGTSEEDFPLALRKENFDTEMSVGKGYRAVNPDNMTLSQPFVVTAKRSRGKVTEYDINTSPYNESTIIVNPDSQRNNIHDGVFNAQARFLQVGVEKSVLEGSMENLTLKFHADLLPGNENTVDDWIASYTPVKEASLRVHPHTDRLTLSYDGQEFHNLTKVATVAALTKGLRIHADDAFAVLDAVVANGAYKFDVWPKQAAQLTMRDIEDYQSYMDPEFGIAVEPPQTFALETMWNGPEPPEQRVGDAWDPAYGNDMQNDGIDEETLLTMAPEQLAQMSNQGDSSAVFEHGVIGSLINAFDATTLVKEYLPKLEEGVDVLGRTLFLFYWKPTDFELAYGADDMTQLENQFLSSFKSLGKVLLELLKRAKDRPQINSGASRT